MKKRTMFLSRKEADKYLNYLVVWTDKTGQEQIMSYRTRKQAENSVPVVEGWADIYTRKQFENRS